MSLWVADANNMPTVAECYYCATDSPTVKPCGIQPTPHCFDCHAWALSHGWGGTEK